MGPGARAVRRLFEEVWNAGHLEVLDEVFAPDVIVHVSLADKTQGSAVFKDVIADWRRAFPDIHHDIDGLLERDDETVVRWHGAGTHRGTFAGIAPTGRPMSYGGMTWCRIEAGRIAEAWVAANVDQMTASLRAAVGR
ncbi:MAG: ester cyclase [Candidatus Dormibacteraceae bacterium]